MNIVTLDFETFFDSDYSLSNKDMTTESYVRDARFEAHGVGLGSQMSDWHSDWVDGPQIAEALARIDWSTTACLCHHAHFDGLILSHHYGIRPAFWFDTLSMARMLIGNHLPKGLDALAKHFGLGAKNVPYHLFKGKHWHEIPHYDREQVIAGCLHDVKLTWDIFCKLAEQFPQEEYAIVDSTIRMFTEPCLVGNTQKLNDVWVAEALEKQERLLELQIDGADLRSNEKFAELLRAEGVEPGLKLNDKGEEIYAFAKTDGFMRDLQDEGSPRVAALAAARVGERSNIVQSRASRLGWMSTRGCLPVYLAPYAAHTLRFGGGDKTNFQNFPRESELGECIEAPPGYKIVVRDASQIECRILNYVAGQWDVIERFSQGVDPYIGIASQFYGFEVTRDQPKERGTGKQLELSCGFGAGAETIKATAAKGTYGPPVQISIGDALRARDLYRSTHPAVVNLWNEGGKVLFGLRDGDTLNWRDVMDVQNHRIYMPNGAPLIYETLEWRVPDETTEDVQRAYNGAGHWRLLTRDGWVKMYGAKLIENVIQALARVHTTQAWHRCLQAGIKMVSMEHDKLIACVPEKDAVAAYDFMGVEMARAPTWLPGIPLDSEGYISRTFKKEKSMIPSWLRWPPNCCETCTGPWTPTSRWVGECGKADSLEYGTTTDARFRCPSFVRKEDK